MNGEVTTRDAGPAGMIEANLAVAFRQGRIDEEGVARFRAEYEKKPYEYVTRQLLTRKPMRVAKPGVRGASFSEAQVRDYLVRTGAIPPWETGPGYVRSVV
jgi:hypothetical protein